MNAHRKLWLVLAGSFLALLLTLSVGLNGTSPPVLNPVTISFMGYTNPPANGTRFALFCVSNAAPSGIRWRGDWVEVEGNADHLARTVNHSLPGFAYAVVLGSGESLTMAVGTPGNPAESGRWKYVMLFSRHDFRERWFDFSLRHNLPLKIGPLLLVDGRRILNASNQVMVSSEWLTK
jgi:hypothetical protein